MATMAMEAGGYRALALALPHSALRRFVYAKKHAARKAEAGAAAGEALLAPERTVYLVNLPLSATDEWLREALGAAFGPVQHVVMGAEAAEKDPAMGRTAHVVFKAKEAVRKLLSATELDAAVPEGQSGIKGYLAKYRASKPGLAAVKQIADKYMGEFDAQEEEEIRQREELKNQVDDDGFVTVVNTKRRAVAAAEEIVGRPAKKQKAKEQENFYRFQMREKKRDQLKTLRERFEEDKLLVDKLKKSNKFKPE